MTLSAEKFAESLEGLIRDAKRYRFLRGPLSVTIETTFLQEGEPTGEDWDPEDFDREIDYAMGEAGL
jgi:hypothetical protein